MATTAVALNANVSRSTFDVGASFAPLPPPPAKEHSSTSPYDESYESYDEPEPCEHVDYIEVAGIRYCGATFPSRVVMAAGDELRWHTSGSDVFAGFTICAEMMSPGLPPFLPAPRTPRVLS